MPKQLSMQTLLDVIKALEIDVPIMRVEEDANGAVTVYLYGGEVKHWPPAAQADISLPFREGKGIGEYTKPPVTRSELAKSKKSGRPRKVLP
mgnify:CR=1 FL=1